MKLLIISLNFYLAFCYSDVGLTPSEIIDNHGYRAETHYITTEDGYILTYHRIPHKKHEKRARNRPAILLHHGLLSSSANFVDMGDDSLAFYLSEEGYDVWLGNSRGNNFSRNHTELDVKHDKKKFFDFSWHEIGHYDLASAIDYILDLTDEESLYYVGHSLGSTAFLVLTSTRPEYNDKIRVAHLLAPAAFMQHCPNKFLEVMAQQVEQLEKSTTQSKMYEVPYTESVREMGMNYCKDFQTFSVICGIIKSLLGSPRDVDKSSYPVFFTNWPSNSAVKPILHYAQLIKTGEFAQYDHGERKNLRIYGSEEPPLYNLRRVKAPVAVYYARNDGLQAVEDVKKLIHKLPNVALDYLVPRNSFTHYEFLIAKDAPELIFDEILKINKKY